jgi:F5/8 type C domain
MARSLIHYCLCIIFLVLSAGAYAGKINLALYRKVVHSSSFDHHTTGHMTVDGSLASFWESSSASRQWLLLDLGGKTPVDAVIIHWGQPYSGKISISTYISHDTSGKAIEVVSKPSLGKRDTIFLGKHQVGSIRFDFEMEIKGLRGCVISEIEALGMAGVEDERFNQPLPIQISASHTSLNSSAWKVQSAAFLIARGEEISTTSFIPDNWIPAQVPGTILGSYHLFGALPDPLYGDNMYQISDRFFQEMIFGTAPNL